MYNILSLESLKKSVQERPFMYIGNKGLIGLFKGLIYDCIKILGTDKIQFSISIITGSKFSVTVSKSSNTETLFEVCRQEAVNSNYFFITVLKIMCIAFDIRDDKKNITIINFELDTYTGIDLSINYHELCETLIEVAILNRQIEIIIKDQRQKFINQNYYHFPQGIFYLFDKIVKASLGKPIFKIIFDGQVEQNYYQISIAYRTDWFPQLAQMSFANEHHNTCGGSLINGILSGLSTSLKVYIKKKGLKDFKISNKNLLNGLIIVCSVKGKDFVYGGSFRETLEDTVVEKQVKRLMQKLVSQTLNANDETAKSLLWRFDMNPYQRLFEKNL